jgi:hypothetical protein
MRRASTRSSTYGGWARCRLPGHIRSLWSVWRGTRSRSRVISRTGCRPCSWSGCRTPHCGKPATGFAPRSSTVASNGRSAGSRWACPRRACPSGAAVSILASRCRYWPPLAPSRRRPSTALPSWENSGWTAACARFAVSCPRWRPRPAPALPRWSWPRRTPRRRRWCPGCASPGHPRWPPCWRGCAANGVPEPGDHRRNRPRDRRGQAARCGRGGLPARAGRRFRAPTCPRCSASLQRAGPRRSAPRAAIICRCSDRRVRARPCSPSGCLPSCPRWTAPPRWRSPPFIRWPGRFRWGARS